MTFILILKIICTISGWLRISSIKTIPVQDQLTCHEVTIHLDSGKSLDSGMLEYRTEHSPDWNRVLLTQEQILSQSGNVVHRLCNLSHRTLYRVRVAESKGHIIHLLGTQYSLTTNSAPMVKLAMASVSTASLATPSSIAVCLNSL